MTRDKEQADEKVHHSRSHIVLTLAGLLLGVLALVVALEGEVGRANAATASTTLVNFGTAVFGLAGAIGYWLGQKWGVYAFTLSVLGHVVAHVSLLLSAIASGRASLSALIGLTVVPVIAIAVLVGMIESARRAK